MTVWTVQFVDHQHNELAVARVTQDTDRYWGTIDLSRTPPHVRDLFYEFEEIVNGQMLSFLDEVQEKIEALGIRARFDDCCEARLSDLQVYPSTGDVSFRVAEAPVGSAPSVT